jgi:hypothetical protein
MAEENPTGRLKIHAELQKPGFTIAEKNAAPYLRRITRCGDPKKWVAFCQNP